jgi:hypothetical protein
LVSFSFGCWLCRSGWRWSSARCRCGENIYRYPMSLTSLECQVSEWVNSDTCPRPTTQEAEAAARTREEMAGWLAGEDARKQQRHADLLLRQREWSTLVRCENIHRYPMSLTSLECQMSALVNSDTCPRPTTRFFPHPEARAAALFHRAPHTAAMRFSSVLEICG